MTDRRTAKDSQQAEVAIADKLAERFGIQKVQAWQRQYAPRKLSVIEVEDKVAVLRPITATEVSQYTMIYLSDGIDKAASFLLNELWIEGDKELIDCDDYFIPAMFEVDKITSLKKSTFYKI